LLQDHRKELAGSKEANDELSKQFDCLSKSMEQKEEYISSLENQINDLTAKAMEMEATLESSQSELRKTKSLLSQAENAIEDHEKTITEVHQEKVAIEKLLDGHREELKSLQSQVESMKHQAEEYTAMIQRLENKSKEDQESIVRSQNTISELRLAFGEEKEQMIGRIKQLEKKTAFAEELQQQLSELEASRQTEREAFKRTLADEQSKSSLLETEAQHRQQRIGTLKRELGASQQALEKAQSQALLEDKHVQELQATIQQLKASNVALEDSKSTVLRHKTKVEAELRSAQMTIEEMAELAQSSVAAHKEEVQALKSRLESIQSPAITTDTSGRTDALEQRCLALESELRKSKRREEKLQALQYRLQQDIKISGGSLETFKNLRDVRALEYELDRTVNRAEKEIASLKAALTTAGKSPTKKGNYSHLVVEEKENILM
jgi:chromosome segregation ATPase